jgi:hypothetical protein
MEVHGQVLQEDRDVAEPEGPGQAVLQRMQGHQSEVVLRTEDPDLGAIQRRGSDSAEEIFRGPIRQLVEPGVELDGHHGAVGIPHGITGLLELVGREPEVQVTIGAKPGLPVESAQGPPLGQDRGQPPLPEEVQGLQQLLLP